MQGQLRTTAVRLADLELWLVALACAAAVAAPAFLPLALVLAAAFWPVRWAASGRLSVRTPAGWAIGLLVLMALVSWWTALLPAETRLQVWRLLLGIALYYAIANWTNSLPRLRTLAAGLAAAGLLLALMAPVSVKWMAGEKLAFIPAALYQQFPLLLADPIHPNIMAGALVLLLPSVLGPLLFAWSHLRRSERALGAAAAAVMLIVLVLTKSRGGLLAVAVALVLLAALRWRDGWLAGLAVVLAAALTVWRLGAGQVTRALAETQTLAGVEGRLEVWSRALSMIQDFPVTGIGMGAFEPVANLLYPFFLAGPDADVPHAHNLFLQVAVDLGLPALVAWLAVFGLACAAAWQVYKRNWRTATDQPDGSGAGQHDPYLAGLAAGLLASQAALAVHGLLDAVAWSARPAVLVWALWGTAMAVYRLGTGRSRAGRSKRPADVEQVPAGT